MTEVLDGGKYLERKASNIWANVLIVPVSKELSQFIALSPKENLGCFFSGEMNRRLFKQRSRLIGSTSVHQET
jgi:hypothetical protein